MPLSAVISNESDRWRCFGRSVLLRVKCNLEMPKEQNLREEPTDDDEGIEPPHIAVALTYADTL